MQTLNRNGSGLSFHEPTITPENMTSHIADLFGPEDWGPPSSRKNTSRPAGSNYLGLSIPNLTTTDGHYALSPLHNHARPAALEGADGRCLSEAGTASGDFSFSGRIQQATPGLHFAPPLYSSQPAFTATNTQTLGAHNGETVSPLQTSFDRDGSSFDSDEGSSTDGLVHSATSAKSMPWDNPPGAGMPPHKRRRNSLKNESSAMSRSRPVVPGTPGRRRKSENIEPGSARAIYLEKNRKAASKCRTKQKKQQEKLVETARDFERKNKVLKAEVEFLKGGMRELMELVGRHSDCPDTRLRTYVQRQADRLVSGGAKPVVTGFLSPKQSATERW